MQTRVQTAAWLLTLGMAAAAAWGQNNGSNQGLPMGPPPTPDTSRMQMEMSQGKPAKGPLKIGFAGKSAEWTAATLAALPHVTFTVFNEHAKADQTYTGVSLIDLLKPLGVPDKPHGKEFRLYLVAEGADGYQVVYALAEVTPDVHDATVIVADALDGKPIGDNGPLQLVATGERRPARWVRNLVAVRVMASN